MNALEAAFFVLFSSYVFPETDRPVCREKSLPLESGEEMEMPYGLTFSDTKEKKKHII